MKVVENGVIPFKGFLAINLFGIVFVRKEYWRKKDAWHRQKCLLHESIHTAQMKELLYVFFYVIYILEWLLRLAVRPKEAYRSISFEVEAYSHQGDEEYLRNRKHFAQWRKIEQK